MKRNKVHRKLKKEIKNSIVVYDIGSIPIGTDIDKIFDMFFKRGVLFYDGEKGNKPFFLGKKGKRIKLRESKK